MNFYYETAPFDWVIDGAPPQSSITKRKPNNKKKKEYVGWASRELIDFLVSIGKDTSKAISQQDITSIINQYIREKNLINPTKKKRVLCDEKLQSLFGRKQSIARNKIYDLLDSHLAENQIDSDGDQSGSPDEFDDDYGSAYKRQKSLNLSKKTQPTKAREVPKSSLVAINAENIKLVYLKKSLVQELLRNPDAFERKVVGSFVRVKSDPHDIFQKNSHELHLVTGVVEDDPSGDKRSILLQISRMSDTVKISELSDENFSKEEIEDLHRRVKDGLLKQPTVGELEMKVVVLHEDITKHWLAKELVLLKNLIDQANVKGVRYKVLEYSDRKKLLESSDEQSRLLSEIPNVIPELVKEDTMLEVVKEKDIIYEGSDDDSPKAVDWDWDPFDIPLTNGVTQNPNVSSELIDQGAPEICTNSNGDTHHSSIPEEKNHHETSFVTAVDNGHAQFVDSKERESSNYKVENNGHNKLLIPNHSDIRMSENRQEINNGHIKPSTLKEQPKKVPIVIDLSDDENDDQKKASSESGNRIPPLHPELLAWYYFDPQGRVHGPFSLTSLKRWNDLNYFPSDFKVWQSGQTPQEAVLLSQVLYQVFPI